MSRYYDLIRLYYRKGLYTARQLEALAQAGAITGAEREKILSGEKSREKRRKKRPGGRFFHAFSVLTGRAGRSDFSDHCSGKQKCAMMGKTPGGPGAERMERA